MRDILESSKAHIRREIQTDRERRDRERSE